MATRIRTARSLQELNLKIGYRSDEDNLIDDFYVPWLQQSLIHEPTIDYLLSAQIIIANLNK